jgi:AcrR family transcriptional regulator
MATRKATGTELDDAGAPAWQQRTLQRSLSTARRRAISRADQLIDAAAELLRSTGRTDFTVQEVVDRAGMSLRAFYHHFASKDDLLLALLEETTARYVARIRPRIEHELTARDKLELLLTRSFRTQISDEPGSKAMVLFHWHLAATRTEEFTATLRPQRELIREILSEGIETGEFRDDLDVDVMAGLLSSTLLTLLDLRVLGVELSEHELKAKDVLAWCLAAVGAT